MPLETKEIIKLFTNNKFRLIALIVVLLFLSLMTFIKFYYTTDDCKPLMEQNKLLLDQSTLLIRKNTELIEGYVKIEELLANVKKDTVFVFMNNTKKIETFKTTQEYSDSNVMSMPLIRPIEIIEVKKRVETKPGNQTLIFDQIKEIIEKSKD